MHPNILWYPQKWVVRRSILFCSTMNRRRFVTLPVRSWMLQLHTGKKFHFFCVLFPESRTSSLDALLRNPPFLRNPPLLLPDLQQGGGFLKRCHFFLDFAVFPLKIAPKTLFLQGNSRFGRLQIAKIFACGGLSTHHILS